MFEEWLVGWLVGCFGLNGPLRQYFSLYRAVSQREGERGEKGQMRVKMSKQPPPAPTASAVGPCPTLIQISRTPRHWKFTQHHRTTRPPPVRRIKVRRDDALKDTNTFVFTFNTSVLPKQLKVAFLRVSVDPYIPNPLRCYACQVFGHHENKCHREEICANCGQPKHSADETDCKRPAKCFNCNEDHPANSKQC